MEFLPQAFFVKLPEVQAEFTASLNSSAANEVPSEQLDSMARRLSTVGSLASRRAIKLKFLEHKVRTRDFRETHTQTNLKDCLT